MRYLYIKNGDVVEQVERIICKANTIDGSGPDAFIADLLMWVKPNPILLISAASRQSKYRHNNVNAIVYKNLLINNIKLVSYIYRFINCFKMFVSILKYKPERIICGRLGSFLWISYLYSKIFSVKYICSRHDTLKKETNNIFKMAHNYFDFICINNSDAIICHGPYLFDQLIDNGIDKKKITWFDISFEDKHSLSENMEASKFELKSDSNRRLLYIGRIEKSKGVEDLYLAFKQIYNSFDDVKLNYVGSGSYLNNLKFIVKEDGLSKFVEFNEYIPHQLIFKLISEAYIVVTPTRSVYGTNFLEASEARCMSAMESLFMGIPVIAPDSGPFPYLIKHGVNGLLYKTNSIHSLGNTLKLALSNKELYKNLKLGVDITKNSIIKPTYTYAMAVNKAFCDKIKKS
jgi:glycosyltransferase involved in cell wall biosynthesis